MPKKKPINKRLNKLFDDIKHEDPNAKPKTERKSKDTSVKEEKSRTTPLRSAPKRSSRSIESPNTITQTDSSLALAFQTGPDNWSTLQILTDDDKQKWSDEDQLLVKQVTDQLELALENARLYQDSQRRAQEMSALAEVGREISATLDQKLVLE